MENENAEADHSTAVPVTSFDDNEQLAHSFQQNDREMKEPVDFGSPAKNFLMPSSTDNEKFLSPAQLESTTLEESVNDSYAQSDGLFKIPQALLESTRISSQCAPGDELETDISKVHETSDSQNTLNAGFLKSNHSSSIPDDSKSLIPNEDSVLAGSDTETVQNRNLDSANLPDHEEDFLKEGSSPGTDDLPLKAETQEVNVDSQQDKEVLAQKDTRTGESLPVKDPCKDNQASSIIDVDNETTNSDPEVEQLMKLPDTVTVLTSKEGVKVYIVGTAHFSQESQEDVAKTIMMTRPRVVVVELCVSRLNILRFDEQTILEEAKNLNMGKIRSTIKQYGAVQGVLYLLFLSTSAHLTRQLGMAPGGEFRRAYHEARNVPGCRIHLGDRPIHVTLHRALSALSVWQKAKLVWQLLLSKNSISAEEVERCKQKDLLEEMLEEMTGEFPALSRVFVEERDLCLAHSMQLAATDAAREELPEPVSVVGVVGIGHVAGISRYFGHVSESDVKNVMKIPQQTRASRFMVVAVKLSVAGLIGYGCYKLVTKVMPSNLLSIRQSILSR